MFDFDDTLADSTGVHEHDPGLEAQLAQGEDSTVDERDAAIEQDLRRGDRGNAEKYQ